MGALDVVPAAYRGSAPTDEALAELGEACAEQNDRVVRAALHELIRTHLREYMRMQPRPLVERVASFTEPMRSQMPADHLVMDDALRRVLAAGTRRTARRRPQVGAT